MSDRQLAALANTMQAFLLLLVPPIPSCCVCSLDKGKGIIRRGGDAMYGSE